MYSRIIATLITSVSMVVLAAFGVVTDDMPEPPTYVEGATIETHEEYKVETVSRELPRISSDMVVAAADVKSIKIEVASDNVLNKTIVSQEEIELLALLTMAEAEGECEEGKRLVIDTVLNRVDSEYFPDTITEVIYQKNQFSSMWNGRVNRCSVKEDICQLVVEELENRTNYDVIFFHAGKYGKYGTPLFQVENHYFSSYD